MNRQTCSFTAHWQNMAVLLVLAVMLLPVCGACESAGGGSGQSATVQATRPPQQPVSGQQVESSALTYVALGASDAVGLGTKQPGSQGYVPLLAARLAKGSHLVNLGISGIRLHEALTQELPIALSTSPQLITIWLVVNDFVATVAYEGYIQDLHTLLQQLRSGTHARIVMANLPDLTLLPAFSNLDAKQKAVMRADIQRWNAGIAQAAAVYNVTVVDLFGQRSQLTSHPQYISSDGFHPSPQGYEELANLFWQAIAGA